jgi:hypothetical protein
MKTLLCSVLIGASLGAPLAAQDAALTVLHGVPGLPAPVEVFANGGSLFSFDYGDQRGPLALPAGTYAVEIRLNGNPILSANIPLAAATSYSAIAHLDAGGTPTVSLFTNDRTSLSLPGSRLTVRHTAQAPAVDVVLEQGGAQVARFSNLSNPNQVAADVAPGVYQASLFVAGTSTRAAGPVGLALENGVSYAIYAVGDVAGTSFRLLTQRDALTARVTVVHGIPGLPAPVDVFAGTTRLFSFDYTDVEGPLVLNPGSYPLSVQLNGTPVLGTTANLAAGDDVTVIAHLDAAGANTLSAFANDVTPLAAGSRLTVRHLAAAPAVDVALDSNGRRIATLQNVVNGQSATNAIGASLFEVSLSAAGQSQVAFGPVPLKTGTGVHYLVHAVGDLAAGSFALVVQTIDLNPAVPGALTTAVAGRGCGPTVGASAPGFGYGEAFAVTVQNGPANGMAVFNVGDDLTSFAGLRLPFDLGALGAPGCFLNTNILATHPLLLDAQGAASVGFFVPRAAFGSLPDVHFSFVMMAPGANALGVLSSDYLTISAN